MEDQNNADRIIVRKTGVATTIVEFHDQAFGPVKKQSIARLATTAADPLKRGRATVAA